MPRKLKTRVNAKGYKEFFDERTGRWELTHRRALENARDSKIPPGRHVHHINHNKKDNRPENLVALKPSVHTRIHHQDADACFRCGRSDHWAEDCDETTDFKGKQLDVEVEENADACFRCGHSGHWADDCDEATDVDGESLDDEDDAWDEDDEDDAWDEDDEDDDWD